LNLFPDLSVAANIFINCELPARLGRIDRKAMDAAAQQVFAMMENRYRSAHQGQETLGR